MEGSTTWTSKLFGQDLVHCSNVSDCETTAKVLGPCPDIIGVYFSFANINSESDEFTQRLVEWYSQSPAPPAHIVQVVLWALSDLVPDYETSYRDSLKGLPWNAVPFSSVDVTRRLSQKYRIKVGAPTLILVEKGGLEVSRPNLELLVRNPDDFPWRPTSLAQLLRNVPLHKCCKDGAPIYYHEIPKEAVKTFYFGAHWCPPCKAFTPQLADTYSVIRNKGKELYLIYISSDRSEESYLRTIEGMPWLTVGWEEAQVRREVARTLGVEGIPALCVVGKDGEVFEVRSQAQGDSDGLNFPWIPSPVSFLTEYHMQRLRDHPAIILFVDGEEEEIAFGMSVLRPAADAYYEEWCLRHPGSPPPYIISPQEDNLDFHYAQAMKVSSKKSPATLDFLLGVETEVSDCVRDMCGLDDAVPLLIGVDYPGGRLCVMTLGEPLTTVSVQHFLDSFLAGQLTCTTLKPFP